MIVGMSNLGTARTRPQLLSNTVITKSNSYSIRILHVHVDLSREYSNSSTGEAPGIGGNR